MTGPEGLDLLAALKTVVDPCSIGMGVPTDICRMGLIESLEVAGTSVRVKLLLTDPSCVFLRGIRSHVIDSLSAVPGVEDVAVELAVGDVWTPDRMAMPDADLLARIRHR